MTDETASKRLKSHTPSCQWCRAPKKSWSTLCENCGRFGQAFNSPKDGAIERAKLDELLFDVRCATRGVRLTQREREQINRLADYAETLSPPSTGDERLRKALEPRDDDLILRRDAFAVAQTAVDEFQLPPLVVDALHRGIADIPAQPEAVSDKPEGTRPGWKYLNEDTGIEWAPDHPVKSGEVPDATEIEAMTLGEFEQRYPADKQEGEARAGLSWLVEALEEGLREDRSEVRVTFTASDAQRLLSSLPTDKKGPTS